MKDTAKGIGFVSILFLSSFLFCISVSAEVRFPYIIDEKPRVTFSDTIATSTYEGLENYNFDYQSNGYAHISFTYTHRYFSDTNFPPYISVTQTDPRIGGFPVHRIRQRVYDLGYLDASDWYKFDLYFDSTGYNYRRQRANTNEVLTYRVDIPDMTDTDWLFLGNDCPYYHYNDDPTQPVSSCSMSFTPHEIKNTEVATGTSVMFFPGVMGSRLYESVNGVEQQDWVTTSDSNQAGLVLDENGKSVKQIYTKDDTQNISDEAETGIVDEATAGVNIYNSFINDLRKWKNEDHIIKDYAFIPYDWRLSLDDIVTAGASTTAGNISYSNTQDFSESFILKKLSELGAKSAHITLIGHSNGGLVIKALVQKLKDTNNPLYYKIDKIIFVAVPQVGTPDAVATLLHGTDLGPLGLVMFAERSRQLSENMPAVYNLLPSAEYFNTANPGFEVDKVVTFDTEKNAYASQIAKYGFYVSNKDELKDYVLGGDGRTKPGYSDTNSPNIGNSNLYTNAENIHSILDSWLPASTTKVIQIAGWGEETVSGITDTVCYDMSVEGYHKCIKPKLVVDGDGTVVVPSALWMSTSTPNVERWWVNLKNANTVITKNRIHRDILEVQKLQDFIGSILTNTNFDDSTNVVVNNTNTLVSGDTRLHYTLHSPLTLGVFDSQGRYTGLDSVTKQVREEIPNVTYRVIGDTQFISIPSDLVGQVKLNGYESGVFALDVEKQQGNTIVESTSFQGIPSGISTKVSMDINPVVASSTLNLDQNGDGNVDKVLKSVSGENVIYDNVAPEISISYSTTTREVVFGALDESHSELSLSSTSVKAIDSQGNITSILYKKYKDKPTKLTLAFNTIVRNGVSTTTPNTRVEYNWAEKNNILTDLDTSVIIKGVEKFIFNYKKSTNTTIIKEKTKTGVNTTTRNGFVVVTVKTNADIVDVSY